MAWVNERVSAIYQKVRVKGKVVHQEGNRLLVKVDETENSTVAAVGHTLVFSISQVTRESR